MKMKYRSTLLQGHGGESSGAGGNGNGSRPAGASAVWPAGAFCAGADASAIAVMGDSAPIAGSMGGTASMAPRSRVERYFIFIDIPSFH